MINDTAAESFVGDVRAFPALDEDFGSIFPQLERKRTADEARAENCYAPYQVRGMKN